MRCDWKIRCKEGQGERGLETKKKNLQEDRLHKIGKMAVCVNANGRRQRSVWCLLPSHPRNKGGPDARERTEKRWAREQNHLL